MSDLLFCFTVPSQFQRQGDIRGEEINILRGGILEILEVAIGGLIRLQAMIQTRGEPGDILS